MFTVQLTESFQSWLDGLRDIRAQVSIARRNARMAEGNLGDVKPVGDGVSELRVDLGPGYRVYYTIRQGQIILLLAGGDKSSQQKNIKQALAIIRTLEE